MNIINNNPYRQLGVYSTSSQRDVVANQGRMRAFLNVGRQVSFPLDLNRLLPEVSRTEQGVAEAASKLTLPAEQLKYAQFWFAKCTNLDDIAFGKLTIGDFDGAIEIWNQKATVSSLQNLLVCALIKNQLENAIGYAQSLYASYGNDFVNMVLGDNALATSENLAHDFLNVLCEELKPDQIVNSITVPEWKEYVGNKITKPLFDKISTAIDVCRSSKGGGASARLNAGTKLMNDTKNDLSQLRQYVSSTDLKYQMIADRLGLEILQCGIDYYNDSEEPEAAHNAMTLQSYAHSIVVGKMAKDRCKDNVDILNKIIEELPPLSVFTKYRAVKGELINISNRSHTISNAVSLLNSTRDDLVSIKNEIGASSEYYLRLSTMVVNCALGFVIEEVNRAQSKIISFEDYLSQRDDIFSGVLSSLYTPSRHGLDASTYNAWVKLHNSQVASFKNVAKSAWDAIKLMDKFDMEKDFKNNRYDENRRILKELCKELGISTSIWSISSGSESGCMVVIAIVVTLGILVRCL